MSKSNYLENELLDHVLRNQAFASPTTVYAALYTTQPSDAGGGTEVSGNAYARVAITFGAATSGSITNSSAVTFPQAGGGPWGTITHFGVLDALTNGNLLYWGALDESKVIDDGDTMEFSIGDLMVTED